MVINCCMFLNENDVLEIKINNHWSFVDRFYILEAGQTHTGDKKPFNLDIDRFKKYEDKLVYIQIDSIDDLILDYPELICPASKKAYKESENEVTMDWIRDHVQANFIIKFIKEYTDPDDIVIFDCLDEIISEDAFNRAMTFFDGSKHELKSELSEINSSYKSDPIMGFNLSGYACKLNMKSIDVTGSLITKFRTFDKVFPTTLRKFSIHTHQPIENGGWHLAWMDNRRGEMVLEKYKSWAHSRDKSTDYYSIASPEEALDRLLSYTELHKVDITYETHPKWLVDNLDKFGDLIC